MPNKSLDYPHPVLSKYSKDYENCDFEVTPDDTSFSENGDCIEFKVSYTLTSSSLKDLVDEGKAKVILRITCFRTSYRNQIELNTPEDNLIQIEKSLISDTVDCQGFIVSQEETKAFSSDEINKQYFSDFQFAIRKADILAFEPGFKIKLDTILEKDMSGIVLVSSSDISEMKVVYAKNDELRPEYSGYITILLPKADYNTYSKLMTRKYLKNGINKFLIASLILPAITEAISLLRADKLCEDPDDRDYSDTVWADSLDSCIQRFEGENWFETEDNSYYLANKILGNVESDSLSNLMRKNQQWSEVPGEDE